MHLNPHTHLCLYTYQSSASVHIIYPTSFFTHIVYPFPPFAFLYDSSVKLMFATTTVLWSFSRKSCCGIMDIFEVA
ncbi:hypothetical protein VNO77_17655 [Canavalia gladiata]|uniref:Uncharacterized protein n=1 Tax=Canavalia gladiata TaxID=3824 RepID=A0AAN9LJJ6_CANGL